MPEQVFKAPGNFFTEIDLTQRTVVPTGVPAGIIGTSEKGPAFVPVTLGSFSDFITKFGDLNAKYPAAYSAERFLVNRPSLTFMRILGAGANSTTSDFSTTSIQGTVKNAGFKVSGTLVTGDTRHQGCVQFLVAKHLLTGSEVYGFPMFSDNATFLQSGSVDEVYLVRSQIFTANDTRIMVLSHNENWSYYVDDVCTANATSKNFKLVISSSQGATFGNDEGFAGIRIYTASLDPSSDLYVGKLLNKDPAKFETERHVLYADFAVDAELASVSTASNAIAIASGSGNTSATGGNTSLSFRELFGKFDARFTTPKTTTFISQPYGSTEYDLFHFEAIDDGEYANKNVKISITNLVASTNPKYDYGTFAVLVRKFNDNDLNPEIIEQFTNCSLDPEADNYVAKIIGDAKVRFNFDVENEDDRRLVRTGKYANRSKYVRIVMNQQIESKLIPADALPFGFRGPEILNTNPYLKDITGSGGFSGIARLAASGTVDPRTLAAVVPPVPYRFKVTRGQISTGSNGLIGAPGNSEIVDARFYWGVKFERNNNNILDVNINEEQNALIPSLTKFAGINKLDVLTTGSFSDKFNSNKFTLARVALGNSSLNDVTASAEVHMKETAYIRDGNPDATNYAITDNSVNRITFASLIHSGTLPTLFNKFNQYAKFTTYLYGGFDGVNILDANSKEMNDRASSTEARNSIFGNAHSSFTSPGFSFNQDGSGLDNNTINSYRIAANLMTDRMLSNINLLSIPGQREPLVADHVSDKVKDYGLALYLMDIPNYNSDGDRIFDGETTNSATYIDISKTADSFETRTLDNTFVASYFPDVVMQDSRTGRRLSLPASTAGLAAIGFNDKVAYPWFAPAGFNRAALNFVSLTKTRVKQAERERLYQVRINPVVKFPNEGYVIFSQKTLDANQTALDSINVQRMVMDVIRQVTDVGNKLIFEQLGPELQAQFVTNITPILTQVQTKQGLKKFRIVCDNTNNTDIDAENNTMNASIFLLPAKAIEFIKLDFVISRNGSNFSVNGG